MSEQPTSTPDPIAKARQDYETAERKLAAASEELVSSAAFAEGLGLFTSNAVALSKVVSTTMDQVVRVSRFAGRKDITTLGKQLARTEDKLEHVLQLVERLEDELAATRAELAQARGTGSGQRNTGTGQPGTDEQNTVEPKAPAKKTATRRQSGAQ